MRMLRSFAWLTLISMLSLSCDTTEPYVHEPQFSKNVSTLYGFEKGPANLDLMPNFTWKDSTGVLRSFSELRGKVVLVNFWATWCVPCLAEMPALRDIAVDFAKDSVVVIGISVDQAGEIFPRVEEFHRNKNLSFQVITDPQMNVYEAYMGSRTQSIPTTFIITQEGAFYTKLSGEQQYDTFAQHIRDLI
jgi:cytochrome c biogenesis protein CcmG, thiol:disulfide interchange protein DsbE